MKPIIKLMIGAHLGFLFLISLIVFPPLSREWPGEFSTVTVVRENGAAMGRLIFDRVQDFPTGTSPIDLPVWPLHLLLFAGVAGFVGAGLAQHRCACRAIQSSVGDYGQ